MENTAPVIDPLLAPAIALPEWVSAFFSGLHPQDPRAMELARDWGMGMITLACAGFEGLKAEGCLPVNRFVDLALAPGQDINGAQELSLIIRLMTADKIKGVGPIICPMGPVAPLAALLAAEPGPELEAIERRLMDRICLLVGVLEQEMDPARLEWAKLPPDRHAHMEKRFMAGIPGKEASDERASGKRRGKKGL